MTKKTKKAPWVEPDYIVVFALRFSIVSFLGFVLLGVVLGIMMRRPLGAGYTQDIVTLSRLQESFPLILIVTAMIQAVVFGFLLSAVAFFWAHRVSGPVVRFRMWLGMIKAGKKAKHIQFRVKDQLHGLAASFGRMQESRDRRHKRLVEDLKAAAGILDMHAGHSGHREPAPGEPDDIVLTLRNIYRAAKDRYLEKSRL